MTTCGNCGRPFGWSANRDGCLNPNDDDCWSFRAERLQSERCELLARVERAERERDGTVATVDLLSEQLTWTRSKLDEAVVCKSWCGGAHRHPNGGQFLCSPECRAAGEPVRPAQKGTS